VGAERREISELALAALWRVQQGFLDYTMHAVDADDGDVGGVLAGAPGVE
jgi:hypothetical protein